MPAPPTGVANLAATIDSIPKNIPRALGPSLEAAVDAAMTTIRYAA